MNYKYDNQFYIKYNPYEQTLGYAYFDQDDACWVNVGNDSKLSKSKYTENTTLSKNIFFILETICDEYVQGDNGISILFEGTVEDFANLKHVKEFYFGDAKIDLHHEKLLKSAKDAILEVTENFDKLKDYFSNHQNTNADISKYIDKYYEATKSEIPLIVTGLYSSGKSAFINALIGDEILESNDEALTAKIFKIRSSDEKRVSFKQGNNDFSLLVNSKGFKLNKPNQTDLTRDLQDAIKKIEKKENLSYETQVINQTLKFLNSSSEKHGISECIKVEFPFNGLLNNEDFNFVIYDTPGSDNANAEQHFETLKTMFKDQANGLPIFITRKDFLSRESGDKLIKVINEIEAFDLSNSLVIINKADDNTPKSLDSLKERILEKEDIGGIIDWQSSNILFASSIFGIAAKKSTEGWINDDYHSVVYGGTSKLTDEKHPYYLQLSKYNVYPLDRQVDNEAWCDEADKKGDKGRLYANSGILTIENEILNYAETNFLYAKYRNASKYLTEATNMLSQEISKNSKEIEKNRGAIERKKSHKIKEIEINLEKKREETNDKFNKELVDAFVKLDGSVKTERESLIAKLKSAYESTKGGNEFIKEMSSVTNSLVSLHKSQIQKITISDIRDKTMRAENKFKEECANVINGSSNFTEDQKTLLMKFVFDFSMNISHYYDFDITNQTFKSKGLFGINTTSKVVVENPFLRFFNKKFGFNMVEATKILEQDSKDFCVDYFDSTKKSAIGTLKAFSVILTNELKDKIDSLNSEVKEFSKEIERLKKIGHELNRDKNHVDQVMHSINSILR